MRSILIALISTTVFVAIVAIALVSSPGWEDVRRSFFDVDIAIASFPAIIAGLWVNIQVLLVAALAGPVAGMATGALNNVVWGLLNPAALPFAAGAALIGGGGFGVFVFQGIGQTTGENREGVYLP